MGSYAFFVLNKYYQVLPSALPARLVCFGTSGGWHGDHRPIVDRDTTQQLLQKPVDARDALADGLQGSIGQFGGGRLKR